jgi:pSer/pThr/pTyr-binding forkhead associated (FHA) protein
MSGVVVFILRILLTLCLYGFLAWAFITIWRDLRNQGQLFSAPPIPNLALAILETEERQLLSFDSAEIVIGRSQSSTYVIPDETVSAQHARLCYHHNQWWVEDLKSTNGTFLNDERVHAPTVVASGDELRCGQVNLMITISEKSMK